MEIESRLLHPGPRFLLASFCQPMMQREQELAEAGIWLGLDDLAGAADPATTSSDDATGTWLRNLRRCETELSSDVEVRELQSLTRALQRQAAKADRNGNPVAINELWDVMSQELRVSLGDAGARHATSSSTLRGRRWGNLRVQIANALAHFNQHGTPTNLLPRDVRDTTTFNERHYRAILDALTERACGGLAVIAAPPGSGKSELALSYARREGRRYDHIFWLRATNRLQLEHDFLEMARLLAPEPGGRAHLRREAFRVLESTSRWLIIFNSVVDPAVLLEYMPWNPDGHKLCTYWPDSRVDTVMPHDSKAGQDTAWSTYLNVHPAHSDEPDGLLKGLTVHEAESFLLEALDATPDGSDLTELATRVSPSRLATVLAAKWINYSQYSIGRYVAEWDALQEPRQRTQDESCGYRAAALTIRGLSISGRWTIGPDDKVSREEAAVDLLRRLESYGAATFPEEILDDPDWKAGDSPLEDRRLAVLDALGLADKANRLPHIKYFAVNSIVRDVVEDELDETSRADSLTISSRTLLSLLQQSSSEKSLQTRLELLPHAEHLAALLAPTSASESAQPAGKALCVGPLLAIEFLAHAAAIHLGLLRVRAAGARLRLIRDIVNRCPTEIRDALALPEQTWEGRSIPDPPDDYYFERPIRRMSQLILTLRLDGYSGVATTVFQAIHHVLQYARSGHLTTKREADPSYESAKADVYFHGALACRAIDDIASARNAIAEALKLWTRLHDTQGITACGSITALIERDVGDLNTARRLAEIALREQRELVKQPANPSSPRAHVELARDLSHLGTISREQGRWKEALHHTAEAATAWSDVPRWITSGHVSGIERTYRAGLEINEVAARSSHTLLKALLGNTADTERDALQCWRRAQAIYPRGHRKAAVILADAAEVTRLVGEVTQARALHEQALEMSERLWSPDHRITTRVRRACAATLLDAGDPDAALRQLLRILRGPSGSTMAEVLARARAWATLGRLLIEVSIAFDPDDDRIQLGLADRVLRHAQHLLDGMTGSQHRHPDVAMCLFGRAEIAIRQQHSDAVRLAQESDDLIRDYFSLTSIPRVAPRARILRACVVIALVPLGETELLQLERDSAVLENEVNEPGANHTPADRLEVALALIAVDSAKSSGLSARDAKLGQTVYDNARNKLEAALRPLSKQVPGEPHQLVARSYAELARLAHRFVGPRQRARNERERERSRPSLDLTHEDVRDLEDSLRGEQERPAAGTDLLLHKPPTAGEFAAAGG